MWSGDNVTEAGSRDPGLCVLCLMIWSVSSALTVTVQIFSDLCKAHKRRGEMRRNLDATETRPEDESCLERERELSLSVTIILAS